MSSAKSAVEINSEALVSSPSSSEKPDPRKVSVVNSWLRSSRGGFFLPALNKSSTLGFRLGEFFGRGGAVKLADNFAVASTARVF